MKQVEKIIVAGAGVMGAGIAQVCAMHGYKVTLYDISQSGLDKGKASIEKNLNKAIQIGKATEEIKETAIANIQYEIEVANLKGDLVIEAVIEKLEIKASLFNTLLDQNPDIILATNTSSIPITKISAAVKSPKQVLGIHFFNPAHIMKLVEVIQGAHTPVELKDWGVEFVKSVGKTPIVAKDAPGFIVNRVARHFYVESLKVLEDNVATHADIDDLMRSSGFRMGAFQLMDLIGVETNLKVTQSMYALFNYDEKFRPSRIQQQKVDAGFWGRKSGKGFYDYEA
ncbi:3-hydroxyacyl-CoA dehydrogenase NAD-binding domain-containing protein [Bacteroidia bacterium]|nr:3-hydroxyacyl-CoA dehydrogenase NAD-binding domain-containing protein [Bacteroidia bacterium]